MTNKDNQTILNEYRELVEEKREQLAHFKGRYFAFADGQWIYLSCTRRDAEEFMRRFYPQQFHLIGTLPELEALLDLT